MGRGDLRGSGKKHQKVVEELRQQLSDAIQLYQNEARKRDEEHSINSALRQEKYALAAELDDEKEKNKKLIAQIHRDYKNSSKSSSQSPNHKKITKQIVNIRLVLEVTEFRTYLYRNSKTGEIYHAPFPKGVVDDVNYGGSIKAFLYLLNNDCATSIDKSRKFL